MKKRKTAIISGANGGIGFATSLKLAQNDYNLILCSRTEINQQCLKLKKEYGIECKNFVFDHSKQDEVYDAGNKIIKEFDKIDVLVNNAGSIQTSLFQMTKDQVIRDQFEINFFSHVFFTKLLINRLRKSDSPSIINISSTSGIDNNIGRLSYNTSKAAIIAFSESLSKDLSMFKIRVNCIAPGLIETKMMKQNTPEKTLNEMIFNNSSKRVGSPEEIAELILFLISDKSSYINGETIRIDGGMI